MTAVADTSPICYLILVDGIEVLPKLYADVVLPEAVIAELRHADAPPAVRAWASEPPSWIARADPVGGSTVGMEKLQAGERGAILLAQYTPTV